jgi:FkbM family methyltransferase
MTPKLVKELIIGSRFEEAARWVYRLYLLVASQDFRRNATYDRETIAVMKRALRKDSNCIDVGCHKGDILREMIKIAPDGVHYAFEPLPDIYQHLVNSYPASSHPTLNLHRLALSDVVGETSFQYVVSAPAYSGFKSRRYDHQEDIEQIKVRTDLLDNVVPSGLPIHFVKIDVEGAELLVLKGAVKTLRRNKPAIVFEHGLGGSNYYGTTPEEIYDLLTEACGLQVSLMKRWLRNERPLTREEFSNQYYSGANYYFMAYEK